MKFNYTGSGDRRWSRIGIGIFLGSVVAGGLPAFTLGGPLWAWAVFVWGVGLLALTAGVVMLIASLRPVHIYLDESAVDIRAGRLTYKGGWEHIAAISVEQVPDSGETPQELLVLWLTDDNLVKTQPKYPATGDPKGHVLADLTNLAHSRAEITEALRRYAGDRFRSLATT